MPRYAVGRPRSYHWEDEDEPFRPHLEVDSHEEVDTGLIAITGEPIMRLPNPLGFGRDAEW